MWLWILVYLYLNRGDFSDIEAALPTQHKDARAHKIGMKKAQEYAKRLGIDGFHFSVGWLHGFKGHCENQFCMISNESGDIRAERTEQWTTISMPSCCMTINHMI